MFSYYNKIIVHGGVFHGDDVTCVAIAKLLNPDIQVARLCSIAPEDNVPTTIIADIGGGKFDHHQENAYKNGSHTLCACELIFKEYKDEIAKVLNDDFKLRQIENICHSIGISDNGEGASAVAAAIASFNPLWDSQIPVQVKFEQAVNYMLGAFKSDISVGLGKLMYQSVLNGVSSEKSNQLAAEEIQRVYNNTEDKSIIVLDRFIPWLTFLPATEAKYVIFPSNRGGWCLQCVPVVGNNFLPKIPLGEKTETEANVSGCSFVHKDRFIASFDTADHAIEYAKSLI